MECQDGNLNIIAETKWMNHKLPPQQIPAYLPTTKTEPNQLFEEVLFRMLQDPSFMKNILSPPYTICSEFTSSAYYNTSNTIKMISFYC